MVGAHLYAKAHAQHLGLTRRQAVQNLFDHFAQAGLHRGLDGRGVGMVFDEVAQMRVVVVANGRLHRDRFLGDFHDLANLVLGNFHLLGQDRSVGLKAVFLQVLATQAVHLVDGLDHVHRNADGARLIGNRACDGLANPPGGVGGEFVAAPVFKLVHRLHQPDIAFLYQVEELQTAVGVFLGNRDHQPQVGFDHLLLGPARSRLALVHALVNVLQVRQRHHHAGLQRQQSLLQLLNRRDVARHHRAPGLASTGLLFHPFQVQQVGGEVGNEFFLRHAALVDDDAAQFAFFFAQFIDLSAQRAAQLFNRLGGEADRHQRLGDGLLRFLVGRASVAFFVVGLAQLLELRAHGVKAGQRLALEFFELARQRLGAALAVVVVALIVVVEVFFGHVVVGRTGIGKTVHHGRDHHLAAANLVGHLQNFGNGRGRFADRCHHVVEAALDALGNLDFAFAREQFDRSHFAHVHAHRVGGAAKFAVYRRQRGFGLFFGFFIAGGGRTRVVEQQGFGVRRLFVHCHAHVVEQRDHHFQRFGLGQFVGQVVVDFTVRQVAACLA